MTGGLSFLERFGPEIAAHTFEHVYLTFVSLAAAVAVAIPLGIYLTRTRWPRLAASVMSAAGIVQTIPSLALLALMVTFFMLVNRLYGGPEWYREGGILPTIGVLPAVLALVLYALLPILRNTYTGIRQVDPDTVEVARGMGMTPRQVLGRVELPLALPFIIAGIRIATVWTIGIATLCGLVGAGGLGDLIMKGLRSNRLDYLVAGTIPAALLALVFDSLMAFIERWLSPPGLRESRN
jgi:osmoprotectant transport system permease protein